MIFNSLSNYGNYINYFAYYFEYSPETHEQMNLIIIDVYNEGHYDPLGFSKIYFIIIHKHYSCLCRRLVF